MRNAGRIRFGAVALLSLLATPSISATADLTGDTGGRTEDYIPRFQRMAATGTYVRISGLCASACTLVLGIVPQKNICVTSTAVLKFHEAHFHGTQVRDPVWTERAFGMYPPAIRQWIDGRGGLHANLITLTGPALRSMYPLCK